MGKTDKPILDVLRGAEPSVNPVWLMRQAGRYLPEYRTLRAKAKDFLNMALTPEWAAEITLQPIRRFELDAAIIFADILLIPMALGCGLEFREGEGPVLEKVEDEAGVGGLKFDAARLEPVYAALARVKPELPAHTALIGFCGAPWTVAAYMIDGNSKNDFALAKHWVREKPESLDRLIAVLVEASVAYLCKQIEAGAEILQVFDSWSGLLAAEDFMRFVIKPTQELVKRVKEKYPQVPIIGFPREAKDNYRAYARETGVDAMGLDQDVDPAWAARELQPHKILQGNLDPALLVEGGEAMRQGLEKILKTFGRKHIVNLGHGVVPQTPPEHVAEMVAYVRGWQG